MTKRPPHRPSRRAAVIDSAMGLFAIHPPDHVTVADIAAAADMTAAAVYYHFPSKEHVLLEGLQIFTRQYLLTLRDLARAGDDEEVWARRLVIGLFDWLELTRTQATVYFAHSAGIDAAIEAVRRETRIEQVVILARAVRLHHGIKSNVGPEVAAIALVSLIENAASSWLTHDQVFLGLGRKRFVVETAAIAERIVGDGLAVEDRPARRRAAAAGS